MYSVNNAKFPYSPNGRVKFWPKNRLNRIPKNSQVITLHEFSSRIFIRRKLSVLTARRYVKIYFLSVEKSSVNNKQNFHIVRMVGCMHRKKKLRRDGNVVFVVDTSRNRRIHLVCQPNFMRTHIFPCVGEKGFCILVGWPQADSWHERSRVVSCTTP